MTAATRAAYRPPPFLSSARLSGVLFELPCDRAVLSEWLRRFGPLSLGDAACSEGDYPVICELWDVCDGALAVGRMDVAAGAVGAYRECMVWVPDVRLGGAPAGSFVAGMLTDSGVARFGDAAFGFGYDKRRGRFERARGEDWRVFGPAGREELCFVGAAPSDAPVDFAVVERRLAAPLLGLTPRGAFVHSWLDRRLRTAAPHSVGGDLTLSGYLVPGARSNYTVGTSTGSASAIAFTGMKARVSYPRILRF